MAREAVFDVVRSMLGRGLRQSEVTRLDEALDLPQGCVPNICCHPKVSTEGLALIRAFEGCARLRDDGLVEAYPDPGTGGTPWTIGWGATGKRIGPGTVWTQQQCDARLAADVAHHATEVHAAIGSAPTSQAQFDALVSFHYNTGAIARSTLAQRHIAGDYKGAASEFARWNRAGGRVLAGLTRRRAAEAALYRSAPPRTGGGQ